MFGYDKINISLSNHWLLLFSLTAIALIFTIYSYRFTLPPISNIKKSFLIFLRFTALFLLILIFFEPVASLQKKLELLPTHLIFIDNSKSISAIEEKQELDRIVNQLTETRNFFDENQIKIFSFGSEVKELNEDRKSELKFDEKSTNLSKVFRLNEIIKDESQSLSIASITLLSDGIITDGINPIYQAEKLGLPIYVFAVGDSSRKKDVFVKSVLFNEKIYIGKPTTISATINNYGYANSSVKVVLIEENREIERQLVQLNESGVNSVNFNYIPKEKGEKKLQIKLEPLESESNIKNNLYPFFLKVDEEKSKILVISGSPNPDFTFIKRVLETDESFIVNSLTQISSDKFLEENPKSIIDSADVIFLISFPNKFTSADIFNLIKNKILTRKTPFFTLINNEVDFSKLKQIENELPVKIESLSDNYIKAQPDINFSSVNRMDLISNISENDWNKIPPVLYPPNLVSSKAESRVISFIKTETNRLKFPLIVQRAIASSRSIAFIGKEFWRWKLQAPVDNSVFDNLILNSVKWLNVNDEERQFKVRTLKRFYSTNEDIEFVAELYDELLNPINNSEIEIEIKNQKDLQTIQLTPLGNGLYEGKIFLKNSGDYIFSAKAKVNNTILHRANGKFNVGDIDVEMIDLRMNYELLSELSKRTNGELFSTSDYESYLKKLKDLNQKTSNVKMVESEIKLWSSEILLILVILLFGTEWLFRKMFSLL
jgi:hypothetical protein